MNLSPKATRFLIEALHHYINHHDHLLEQDHLSEDEISDLMNDRSYLEAIKQDVEKYRDELMPVSATAHADS